MPFSAPAFPVLFAQESAPAIADLARDLKRIPLEEFMLHLTVQLAVIVVAARVFGWLLRKLGQPTVVGEIMAGIALGPSILGQLAPDLANAIFHPTLASAATELTPLVDGQFQGTLASLSQIGLMLLLFLVGLEFDFGHLRGSGKSATAISLAGIVAPFALGIPLAWWMFPLVERHPDATGEAHALGFALFLGMALSITALPVLGRIMLELNITRTRLGAVTIASAAINDAVGWTLLAAITAIVRQNYDPLATLRMVVGAGLFAAAMVFVARPALRRWTAWTLRRGQGDVGLDTLATLLVLIFVSALATNLIGIFAIFGPFFLGAILSGDEAFREAVSRRLSDLVTIFFLPIFFTYTGLRTNIGSLQSLESWLLLGGVLIVAVLGKFAGCGLAARLGGCSSREAICVGGMMNARGLMELVVINVGYDLQVIPPSVYCMLVIMAIVTTFMTTPILMGAMRGTELEAGIRASKWMAERNRASGKPAP